MRSLQAVLLIVFLAAVAIFALQNNDPVTVAFLRWNITAPMALAIVAVYLLGMLTGWTVVSFVRRSVRKVTEERRD